MTSWHTVGAFSLWAKKVNMFIHRSPHPHPHPRHAGSGSLGNKEYGVCSGEEVLGGSHSLSILSPSLSQDGFNA